MDDHFGAMGFKTKPDEDKQHKPKEPMGDYLKRTSP